MAPDRLRRGVFDPTAPAFTDDPYPLYRKLRTAAPLFQDAAGTVYLSRHADVAAVLGDQRFGKDFTRRLTERGAAALLDEPVYMSASRWLLEMDPPEQQHAYRAVAKILAGPLLAGIDVRVAAIVDGVVDGVLARGEMDLVTEFAEAIPVAVMCELIGIPAGDRAAFCAVSDFPLEFFATLHPDRALIERANADCLAQAAYLDTMFDERLRRPANDLISHLAATDLDRDAAIALIRMLYLGGSITTAMAIGNTVAALFGEPDRLRQTRTDPVALRNAFEEGLRYSSPIQMLGRTALVDADVAGVALPAGTDVIVLIGAANRDPAVFTDPESFRLDRTGARRGLSFGAGLHRCLGSHLARIEFAAALGALLHRFPDLEVDGAQRPRWRRNHVLRGLAELPCHWAA